MIRRVVVVVGSALAVPFAVIAGVALGIAHVALGVAATGLTKWYGWRERRATRRTWRAYARRFGLDVRAMTPRDRLKAAIWDAEGRGRTPPELDRLPRADERKRVLLFRERDR